MENSNLTDKDDFANLPSLKVMNDTKKIEEEEAKRVEEERLLKEKEEEE